MVSYSLFKNTFLFSFILMAACGNSVSDKNTSSVTQNFQTTTTINDTLKIVTPVEFNTGAENFKNYASLLKGKKTGIVTNQTGTVKTANGRISIVDFLLSKNIAVKKIYAPEHGFRGTADAGELVKDGKDTQTGLPVISLYGNNKKPKPEQLEGIDVMVFDLQDVGARFYTYISTLHYIIEACAENNIPLIVFDRPNPNGSIVDGPVLEKENTSFIGMHAIPVLHGMTIGEYAKMIVGEKWTKSDKPCNLSVIPCSGYKRDMPYSLPDRPSPNLPNDQSINLYASLCFFEGTNVSMGRGTEKQFQIYGSPYLSESKFNFSFIPKPNFGAKDPLYNGKECYGEDLSKAKHVTRLELKWLLKAYAATADKSKFFIPFFTKLAGTTKLQQQIESGKTEEQIRQSWQEGLIKFRETREKYFIYEE
ncbi:DUF1343 domain-containing protein [Flavobacterium sp. DG1-102-2]|uniref:exo-beta-N-acetylmuramidase NamZ family protein n=1 Tax=Flavobacterium sp. DG1-102-2 TaxID=3081663 RepID=UPI00294A3FC9|nr:DUF1343 domain-containing protein [Flavobacterium sp. DG1-102-2]MDV6169160.1 DUF1343 domain-containing protein [Flavobacterium sp. DG1-102-2]